MAIHQILQNQFTNSWKVKAWIIHRLMQISSSKEEQYSVINKHEDGQQGPNNSQRTCCQVFCPRASIVKDRPDRMKWRLDSFSKETNTHTNEQMRPPLRRNESPANLPSPINPVTQERFIGRTVVIRDKPRTNEWIWAVRMLVYYVVTYVVSQFKALPTTMFSGITRREPNGGVLLFWHMYACSV